VHNTPRGNEIDARGPGLIAAILTAHARQGRKGKARTGTAAARKSPAVRRDA